jgi:predicted metal-dependent hydrolase
MNDRDLSYLAGYAQDFRTKVRALLLSGRLEEVLSARYPDRSPVQTDGQLREYVLELKNKYLKRSPPLSKVCFDDKISASHGALGLHTFVSRVQGAKTKAKNELRVAAVFRTLPEPFVRMVVVHELAHLREKEHNKAFYQLCCHMEPDYHRLELDLRLTLTLRDYKLTQAGPGQLA